MQSHAIRYLVLLIILNIGKVRGDNLRTPESDYPNKGNHTPILGIEDTESQKSANYIINPKLSYCYPLNEDDSYCYYSIDDEHRSILTHQNKLIYIVFNDSKIHLDNEEKSPKVQNWSHIRIYLHKKRIPILIQIISSERSYFYALNRDKGEWSNYSIDSLKDSQKTDENGITCYKLDSKNHSNPLNEKLPEVLSKLSAELPKDNLPNNGIEDHYLEINIALPELLHESHHFSTFRKNYDSKRPKLELSSFRGEGDIRIQAYTLDVKAPVARAILVHGYRNTFQSEFLNYNPKYFDKISSNELKEYTANHTDAVERNIKLKYEYGNDFISAEELKSMIDGQIQLEDTTADIYKDGTDGWGTTDRYVYEESFAQALNLNNISVHGLDLRSFGASEAPEIWTVGRVRALIDDFDNISKDLITFIKILREKYNDDLPIYLIGVSMGGAAVARALELLGNEKLVDGAILVAPMMKICNGILNMIYKYAKPLLDFISYMIPKTYVGSGERGVKTDFKSLLKTDDPYCPNTYSFLKTGFNFISVSNDIMDDAGKINSEIPILLIHSTTDDVNFFEGTEEFYNSLTQVKRKYFINLNNLDHYETTSYKYFNPLSEFVSDWILDEGK